MIAIRRLTLLTTFAIVLQGCAGPTPKWLIHVEPPEIRLDATAHSLQKRLIDELAVPELSAGYLPAEQIALLAAESIKANQGFDAALFLAIASYRYSQQAMYAIEQAKKGEVLGTPPDIYVKFVKTEFDVFSNLHFNDELTYLFDFFNHPDERDNLKIQTQHQALAAAKKSKHERLYAKILRSIQSAYRSPKEHLQYPAIADAFYHRLISDASADGPLADAASYYLASMPIKRFREAALIHPYRHFWPPLCGAMSQHISVYGQQVLELLGHDNPKVRSNAAIILGLSQDRRFLPRIETASKTESLPKVKTSLAFSRHLLGQDSLKTLLHEVNACGEDSDCEHAIQLIAWLPNDQQSTLPADLFVNQLSDTSNSILARGAAALILGDIQSLEENHLSALLIASEDEKPYVANAATTAVEQTGRLDIPSVQKYLSGNHGKVALFSRWATIATPENLSVLNTYVQALSDQPETVQEALITTLGAIKGEQATKMLTDLYEQRPEHRLFIAMILSGRPDLKKDVLKKFAALSDGPASLALKMAGDDQSASDLAKSLLSSGTLKDKLQTLQLTAHFMRCDLVSDVITYVDFTDNRHYPNDAIVRFFAIESILRCALSSSDNLHGRPTFHYQDPAFRNGS